MLEHYHDAMAICKFYGHLDLFITFTSNPLLIEIKCMLGKISGQRPKDRLDIVARVFKAKLDYLVADIKKHDFFGHAMAILYTIEFRKKGLPYVHCLVWLEKDNKIKALSEIDSIISTELSCKKKTRSYWFSYSF